MWCRIRNLITWKCGATLETWWIIRKFSHEAWMHIGHALLLTLELSRAFLIHRTSIYTDACGMSILRRIDLPHANASSDCHCLSCLLLFRKLTGRHTNHIFNTSLRAVTGMTGSVWRMLLSFVIQWGFVDKAATVSWQQAMMFCQYYNGRKLAHYIPGRPVTSPVQLGGAILEILS